LQSARAQSITSGVGACALKTIWDGKAFLNNRAPADCSGDLEDLKGAELIERLPDRFGSFLDGTN
jgi:hypothetical protein